MLTEELTVNCTQFTITNQCYSRFKHKHENSIAMEHCTNSIYAQPNLGSSSTEPPNYWSEDIYINHWLGLCHAIKSIWFCYLGLSVRGVQVYCHSERSLHLTGSCRQWPCPLPVFSVRPSLHYLRCPQYLLGDLPSVPHWERSGWVVTQ